ncbi:hypothetical protein EON82_13030 [bacterium]|nr:MAG: hypothetical protein EON82_13030 [bacterium]
MVAGAYGLIRFALGQSRDLSDRFLSSIEKASDRQEAAHERLATALESQGKVLERIAERVRR